MKLVWSNLAKEYYIFIVEQIFEKWSIEIVKRFEIETFSLIDKIENHNHICPKSKIIICINVL